MVVARLVALNVDYTLQGNMQQIMHYHTWVTVRKKLKMSSKGMRLTQWGTMSMSALSSFIGLLWSIRYNAMSVQCKELSIRSLDGYKNKYNSTMEPCCSNRSRVFWSFPWWNFVSLVFRTSHTCITDCVKRSDWFLSEWCGIMYLIRFLFRSHLKDVVLFIDRILLN